MKTNIATLILIFYTNWCLAQKVAVSSPSDIPHKSYSTKAIHSDNITVKKWLHSVATSELKFIDELIKSATVINPTAFETLISTKIYCHFILRNETEVLNAIMLYRNSSHDSVKDNPHHIPFQVFAESASVSEGYFEEAFNICLKESLEASNYPDQKKLLKEIAKALQEAPASFLQQSEVLTELEEIQGIPLANLLSSYARALLSFKVLPIIFEEIYNRENNIIKN